MKLGAHSFQFRVVFHVFATSLVMLLLFGSLIFFQISNFTRVLEREDLLEQARKIAAFIEYDWLGRFEVDLPRRYETYYTGNPHHQFAVFDRQGQMLFSSSYFMKEKIQNTLDKGGKHYFSFQTQDGKHYAGLKYDYLFNGKIYPIYVIEYEEEFSEFINSLEDTFLHNIVLFGVPLLLIQGALIILLFKGALKPILQAAKDARQIKYDNLSYRLNENDVHSELLPLIQSVNNGLSRLEKSAEAQKFFIANAAHELRTPLSILKARIASIKDESKVVLLNRDLQNINRLISQMLDISRLDLAETAPKSEVSLNTVAQEACTDIGPLFIENGKELSLEQRIDNQIVFGNEDTLFRAVLNLLENALKHTPEKSPVRVIVDKKRIIVRDYGDPIPDEYKIKIFERFEKAPQSSKTAGSGLGLAIVMKAAEINNGTISIITRDNGNDFVLDFG